MLQMVLEWVYYILCMVCMVSVGEWTYHWTVKNRKRIAIAGALYIIAFVFCIILFPSFSMLFYVFELLSWSMLCKPRLKDKIFKIIVLFFIVGIPEAIASILIDFAGGYWIAEEIRNLMQIAIAYLFFYVITRRRWYKKIVVYLESISWLKSILIFLVIVFGQMIVVFGNVIRNMLDNRNLMFFFRIVLAIELCAVIGIVLWLIRESYQKKYYLEQNYLKEEYIRTQQEYYRTIYEKDKEMRSFRHDMVSQMGLLQMLLERGDLDSAKEHLNSIHQNFSQASFHKIHVGDEMLDAILSMMNQKASERGVQIEITGRIENQNVSDIYDLCTVFSNAINNAIEACDKIIGEKRVCVKIMSHNQTLYFKFENPATEEMFQSVLLEETTKVNTDNHGYGIRNIRKAVERLNGSMEYGYGNGKIALEIYI